MSEKKIKPNDPVTIYVTGKSKYLPKAGEERKVHREAAEKLVKKGYATYDKPAAETETKGKKGKS